MRVDSSPSSTSAREADPLSRAAWAGLGVEPGKRGAGKCGAQIPGVQIPTPVTLLGKFQNSEIRWQAAGSVQVHDLAVTTVEEVAGTVSGRSFPSSKRSISNQEELCE
jgi:hypothetical protein